jgi:hypothetical protein
MISVAASVLFRLWGKIFERAASAKGDFDAASITAFLWAATTAGGTATTAAPSTLGWFICVDKAAQLWSCVGTCLAMLEQWKSTISDTCCFGTQSPMLVLLLLALLRRCCSFQDHL